jgi:hypothetical protein
VPAQTRLRIRSSNTVNSRPLASDLLVSELALNVRDGILFSTDGIKVFEIGANTTNSVVQDTLTINAVSANGTIGLPNQILTSDGTGTYWGPLSDGHGFYRGNNGEKPPGVLINRENIFRVNSNTIVTDITFLTGENATATGPIEIVSGITLTVQQNSRVVII